VSGKVSRYCSRPTKRSVLNAMRACMCVCEVNSSTFAVTMRLEAVARE